MGMFDSLYDADGNEWQTKAFDCGLYSYRAGDVLPDDETGPITDYQVRVIGDGPDYAMNYATVHQGALTEVPAERDPTSPLLDYHGGWIESGQP